MRIALGLEYDGSAFCGWQSQPEGCSIQDALERALAQIAGHPVRVTAAGRTDTGVHALLQVVHFDTEAERPDTAWVRGTNAFLPKQIAVLWAQIVDDAFHARFSAIQRSYRYLLLTRAVRLAINQSRLGWFHQPLDLARMREAAVFLVGEHDFNAFRSAECQAKSSIRQLRRLDIEQRGDLFEFNFSANGFLHHMIRNIVGSLVYVGKQRFEPEWVQTVLSGRERAAAAPTFAPDGLYLSDVQYGDEWRLPDFKRNIPVLL